MQLKSLLHTNVSETDVLQKVAAVRAQRMALDLIAWQPSLYQVLALPGKRTPASPTALVATAGCLPAPCAPDNGPLQ